MEKILVSACLLGDKTRYDGKDNLLPFLSRLVERYELVPFCPEVEGGLPVPRPRSEIKAGGVVNEKGEDVTSHFVRGAEKALALCSYLGIKTAILKDRSPSCGVRMIHDGSFTHHLKEGQGITTARLLASGIKVYSDSDNLEFLLGEAPRAKKALHEGVYRSGRPSRKPLTKKKKSSERPFKGKSKRPYGKKSVAKGRPAHRKGRKAPYKAKPHGNR